MIKEKGKEICQRVLDTNTPIFQVAYYLDLAYNNGKKGLGGK